MSSNLYWTPTDPQPPRLGGVGVPLKSIIVRRLWDEHADGSLCYRDVRTMTLAKDGEWLCGIVDGAQSDQLQRQAMFLLDALRQYGSLDLTVEG